MAPAADQSDPVKVIQAKIDRTLQIVRDKSLQKPESLPTLRKRLVEELEPLFTFREMTFRALGAHARQLKPEQIDALAASFKTLLQRVYIDQLTAHMVKSDNPYTVEDIRITSNELRGNYARINSLAVIGKHTETSEIQMNYRMVKRPAAGWQVYDLEIEGVSLIDNYRSQFNEVLTNHPFEYLLDSVQKNVASLDQPDLLKTKKQTPDRASPPQEAAVKKQETPKKPSPAKKQEAPIK